MKKKVTADEEFLFKTLFLHIEKHIELYHMVADDEIERYKKAYKAFMDKNFGETYMEYSHRWTDSKRGGVNGIRCVFGEV